MRDPYFGNRNSFTGEPTETPEVWTEWDYALMSAYQVIQDHSDNNGILAWENESDNVTVNADRKISKFDAAREKKTSGKNYKSRPGERYVPNVQLQWGDWPTYSGWVQSQSEDTPVVE